MHFLHSLCRCTLQWEAITRRLTNNSKVYSCGSSLSGVLAHGPETNLCVAFTSIEFPFSAQVAQVSATQNHSSFVLQSGEVGSFCLYKNLSYWVYILLVVFINLFRIWHRFSHVGITHCISVVTYILTVQYLGLSLLRLWRELPVSR